MHVTLRDIEQVTCTKNLITLFRKNFNSYADSAPIILEDIPPKFHANDMHLMFSVCDKNQDYVCELQEYFLTMTKKLKHFLPHQSLRALNTFEHYHEGEASINEVQQAILNAIEISMENPLDTKGLKDNAGKNYFFRSAQAESCYVVSLLGRVFFNLIGADQFKFDPSSDSDFLNKSSIQYAFYAIGECCIQACAFYAIYKFLESTTDNYASYSDTYITARKLETDEQAGNLKSFLKKLSCISQTQTE